ncbi:bifunctional 4-hydroxy-2-oxoglutarate aldolase/2-dehydro-3-deoxy-phosphogluconate aldolase [Joostella atrarenae]|uniref:Bifunctional 4-hydroxy-2-oxoglutarate aldolase/2-dehydro-3-deoxy-phosphogluconate aldolase n=1 Tax=Joostella atrarenae TaxID=679257 RepID=A0ABS9J752_9FLAO|nr:bifunctional 4-hydroxy-2-oxoglutarate aldolase/2-dehydro-3-deoxy-phosphogluconate aldolase [Joostella atrarenae]MCF8716247.1 bifunctional 4-hydroxy-2-oxoglutarate aldolase/2-dehydro-3-deoxy-phosphogluconate aldolase [Joostella atrarenae]
MKPTNRIEVAQQLTTTGLVPLFYHNDIQTAKNIVRACYEGGAIAVEFTARGAFAYEVFEALVKYANHELPGMLLGIGSITDAAAASLYMQLGADFVVTPVFREDIAKVCNRRKVLWMPGCGSLTEIAAAEELGCEIIKLFPGAIYGAEFVKAIKGPQPWTKIMPTGGVSTEKEDLKKWFNAGVCCVGMGSNLIKKDNDGNFDYLEIETLISATIENIKLIRANH